MTRSPRSAPRSTRSPRCPRLARAALTLPPVLVVAALASSCLPDQLDGRQEPVVAPPAVDLSWAQEATALEVVDAALLAMAEVGSVRLRQDAEAPEGTAAAEAGVRVVSKDLLIATGDGIGDAVAGDCTGTLQLPGWAGPAELVVQDDLGAFRGDADFWRGFGGDLGDVPDVREILADQYADAWTTTPGLAALCAFTEFLDPLARMVGDDDATKAGLGDVAGVPAVRVSATGKRTTTTAWVRVAEPHLVLRIALEQQGEGSEQPSSTVTTFSDVDTAVTVDFPAPDDIRAFEVPTQAPPESPVGGSEVGPTT